MSAVESMDKLVTDDMYVGVTHAIAAVASVSFHFISSCT